MPALASAIILLHVNSALGACIATSFEVFVQLNNIVYLVSSSCGCVSPCPVC